MQQSIVRAGRRREQLAWGGSTAPMLQAACKQGRATRAHGLQERGWGGTLYRRSPQRRRVCR
eukprot:3489273-Rhodomonas_salina.3